MERSVGRVAVNKRQKVVRKFYHSSIFRMARCWAKVPRVEWARVRDPLFNQCPKPPYEMMHEEQQQLAKGTPTAQPSSGGNWVFTPKGRDAVLALGIFLLESDGGLVEHILPYLLQVEEGLFDANIPESSFGNQSKTFKTTNRLLRSL